MNRKDIAMIRRRYAMDKNAVSVVRGCYVNENREIVSTFEKELLAFPQSEAEHYLSLFRRTLGGAVGRNLFGISVPEPGKLEALWRAGLKDERAVDALCRTIIDSLEIEGSYLILMCHDACDLPRKKSEVHGERPDFDGNVLNYVMVSVCPVKLTKPMLTFFASEREFHSVEPDLAVGAPELGFMYPSLEDGAADVNAALFFTRDTANIHADFIDGVFGSEAPQSADDQRQAFQDVLTDALDEALTFDVVQTIHDNLVGQLADRRKDAAPLEVSRREISSLLESCEVPKDKLAAFEAGYNAAFGKGMGLDAQNMIDEKRFEIAAGDAVTIQVDPGRSDLIEMKRLDGRRCVIVYVEGDVSVNGVEVNI